LLAVFGRQAAEGQQDRGLNEISGYRVVVMGDDAAASNCDLR
jgi:hypothetical protein